VVVSAAATTLRQHDGCQLESEEWRSLGARGRVGLAGESRAGPQKQSELAGVGSKQNSRDGSLSIQSDAPSEAAGAAVIGGRLAGECWRATRRHEQVTAHGGPGRWAEGGGADSARPAGRDSTAAI
jgi:hypothetical protein